LGQRDIADLFMAIQPESYDFGIMLPFGDSFGMAASRGYCGEAHILRSTLDRRNRETAP
jgi:hypothetical protein